MAEHFTIRNGVRITKQGYRTKKLALAALHRTAGKKDFSLGDMNVYKCPVCKKWHFGRDRYQKQDKERQAYGRA